MTNPTRTRAEIQAEIEKLQAELKAVPERKWKVGDRFYCEGKVTSEDDMDCAFVDVLLELERDETALYRAALIPAADLIPREEHEAALIEANTRTDKVVLHLNARDAIRYLVKEYALDAPGEPRSYLHYHDGLEYRVTVERVDDHIPDATKKVEPTDAEPVGWANIHPDGSIGKIYRTAEAAEEVAGLTEYVKETAAPLYRHPAPAKLDANTALKYLVNEYDLDTGHMDSARPRTYPFDHNGHVYEVVVRRKGEVVATQAVAPGVVVDEIRSRLMHIAKCMPMPVAAGALGEDVKAIDAALARITELPKPSDGVECRRTEVGVNVATVPLRNGFLLNFDTVAEVMQLASDCVRAAALLAKVGE